MADLERQLGFSVKGYSPGTIAVPPHMQIDEKKLKSYLNWALKLHDKGTEQGMYRLLTGRSFQFITVHYNRTCFDHIFKEEKVIS